MGKTNHSQVGSIVGIALGAVGIVGGLVLWKMLKGHEFELESADASVAKAVKKFAPKKTQKKRPPKKLQGQINRLVEEKEDKVDALLKLMKPRKSYTQVQLQELSGFSYRSVRRYIEILIDQKKVTSTGYGRGKMFKKRSL